MQAASGELNLTVITLIAIGAVIAFFTFMFNGPIKNSLNKQWASVDEGYIVLDSNYMVEK